MKAWLLKKLSELFGTQNDPVRGCDVYKDKASGSCVHVDGPVCDYPNCALLRKYRECNQASDCALQDNPPIVPSTLE